MDVAAKLKAAADAKQAPVCPIDSWDGAFSCLGGWKMAPLSTICKTAAVSVHQLKEICLLIFDAFSEAMQA